MPKGRHGGKSKTSKKVTGINKQVEEDLSRPLFRILEEKDPCPLLTLLFETKTSQHAALSRIEAFYESTSDTKKYLSLDEGQKQRICQHYEAFNFPIKIVNEWLLCMKRAHPPSARVEEEDSGEQVDTAWWKSHCNDQEKHLLDLLVQLGAIDLDEEDDEEVGDATCPVYLISTLSSKQPFLRHERLHFLYYISPEYRIKVQDEYRNLSVKTRKIIETDLSMRKYSSHVWIDEFQAYISESAFEFGKSIQEECQAIQATLLELQRQYWR